MTTLPELLKQTDPLGDEPRDEHDRQRRRQVLLSSAPPAADVPRRTLLKTVLVAAGFVAMVTGGLYWSRAAVDVVAAVRFEVRLAEEAFAPGLTEAEVAGAGRKIYFHQETIVTNSDITQAQLVESQGGATFGVSVTFKAAGADRMRRATQDHIGRPLAILIDGTVVMAPTVRAAVATEALISGDYTKGEAERIVSGIVGK